MSFGLKDSTIRKVNSILASFPEIEEAMLYGSRAKGNYKTGSDIDLTLIGKDIDLRMLNKVSLELDNLSTPYKFDLSIYQYIENKDLIDHINRIGITFYRKNESEWRGTSLRNVSIDISYGYTASANDEPVGPKFLRITDIVPERINWDTVPYCEIEKAIKSKYELDVGDIVVARTGATTGYSAIIKEKTDAVFASYLIRYRIDPRIANPFYIGYLLKSERWKGFVENAIGGSAQPGANAQQFADFEFDLPSMSEQNEIVEVLSSLDDKIDLLHRQNKTLEALAETLFRQWFVEEAEEWWKEKRIKDVAIVNEKSIDEKFSFQEIEYLETGSITEGQISEWQFWKLNEAPSRARRILQRNDIVFSMVRPIQKHYGILKTVKPNSIASTGFAVITCKSIDPHFIYLFLTQDVMTEYLEQIAEGSTSTYPSLRADDVENLGIKLPPKEKLNEFSFSVANNFEKIETNKNQIRSLTQFRDSLLPKLMSGEIRVK